MRYELTDSDSIRGYRDDGVALLISANPDNRDYAAYLRWLKEGNTPDPAPGLSIADFKEAAEAAVQKRLDDFAKTRGYASIVSACTYATSKNDQRRAEGQYCVDARDESWDICYAFEADVGKGLRPMPSDVAEVLAALPPLKWPV